MNRIEISIQQIEFNYQQNQYEVKEKKIFILPYVEKIDQFESILQSLFLTNFNDILQKYSDSILFCCSSQCYQYLYSMKSFRLLIQLLNQLKRVVLNDFKRLIKEFKRNHFIHYSDKEIDEKVSGESRQIVQHWCCDHHYFIPTNECAQYKTNFYLNSINSLLSHHSN